MTISSAPLTSVFHGELIEPGHADYDRYREIWNGSIDRRPTAICRCRDAMDVAAAITHARSAGLDLAVRGGGHSFPGHSVCDDGVVADLSPMRGITLNLDRGTARVQAGVLLGELDGATQQHGLAVPAGIVSHTGIAGLTLGGGMGWLVRKYGLSIDNLLGVDLVTATGELIRADERETPDLFWGVRGGGGNFGVVTEFEFRLRRVGPQVVSCPVFWPIDDAERVLRFYRDWIADAPDDLMTIVSLRKAPASALLPEELHGRPVVAILCLWAGDVEDGFRAVAPLRSFGQPAADGCAVRAFVEHQAMLDPSFSHGWWYYVRACDVAALTDEVIDVSVEYARRIESPLSALTLWGLGGAMARVDEDATAFYGRAAAHAFNISGITATRAGFEREQQWARDFWSALEPHRTSVYVNYLSDDGASRLGEAYGAAKLARLRSLKTAYDPDNVFHLNQNIPPLDG
ncbi:FAD-binding oxidoreductase [Phytoactinopolyspora endophytica]|uniref:FAD-binding oxidoreductase n=1 Tax=Phytoactinopolyspora endophytica TaxID=1642495 RepID=UPI00101C60E9|nr:FAD-binding oxidoreductase [Phytoactinopolyspora endophytica]